jgi:hypothetical protein
MEAGNYQLPGFVTYLTTVHQTARVFRTWVLPTDSTSPVGIAFCISEVPERWGRTFEIW